MVHARYVAPEVKARRVSKRGPEMSSRTQLADQLGQVPLFSRCNRRDLRIVARHIVVSHPGPDVEIVVEGEKGNALYVLTAGAARVFSGGEMVAELGPGDYFGELALLDPSPRAATVVTTTDSEVAVLGARIFHSLLRDIPQLSSELLAQLARQLRCAGGHRPVPRSVVSKPTTTDHDTNRKERRDDLHIT